MTSDGRIEERLARRGGAVELLRLPAAVFGALAGLRGALYDRGILPAERVDAPVISVGNLTAGGTGKTPFVALIVRELARRGLRPGVVARGYGARAGGASDEMRELAAALDGVPLRADPDRARGARALLPACDAVVLDDGFQHRRLARDLDLVLVDATRPFGLAADGGPPVRAFLPRGLLRESPAALARAHAVVLTRADQAAEGELAELQGELERWAPGAPFLRAVHRPVRLAGLAGLPDEGLETLRGARVWLASGIAHPAAFERSARDLGAVVAGHRRFPDHHAWSAEEARALEDEARRAGALLVTTGKDAVKLAPLGCRARALAIELELTAGAPALAALLDALPRSRARREREALHGGLSG
jgi:tetraacyldisaccharide 4'-kinase